MAVRTTVEEGTLRKRRPWKRRLTRFVVLCFLPGLLAAAGAKHCRAQTQQLQNWTTEEGLPQNSVHSLLQAQDGYLWLATEAGVARFNGLRFQRYSSANEPAFRSDDVCCIAEGEAGVLLFGTANGLVSFQDRVFRSVPGVVGQVLALQRAGDGSVLVLTDSALQRIAGGEGKTVDLAGRPLPSALGGAADGSVLVVAGKELLRIRGTSITTVGQIAGGVQSLWEDAAGDVWEASANAVELRDRKLQVVRRWQVGRDLPGNRMQSLQPWPGGVLVGTNREAAVLHAADRSAAVVSSLKNNAVLSALVDREGDEWFGTDSSGVFSLRERSIGSVPALAGESVTAFAEAPDGRLWIGTRDEGLRMMLPHQAAERPAPVRLSSEVVLSLAADQTGVWAGTPEGLDHLEDGRVTHMTAADGLPDDFVKSLLLARDGTLWAGTRRGTAMLKRGRVERALTEADGLPSDVTGAMLQGHDGTVWVSTLAGLAGWDGKQLRRLPASDGSTPAIASLHESQDGTLWIGTGQGLFVRAGDRMVPVHVSAIRGSVAAILEDSFKNLWIRTASGLLRVPAAGLLRCVGESSCAAPVRQFGVADGMPGVELPTLGIQVAVIRRDGTLWFATRRGAAVVNPQKSDAVPVAPPVAIEEVEVDGRTAPMGKMVEVGSGGRRVAISFAGLSLSSPGQVRYRYLLAHFDRNWSAWQSSNVADYTNLPPGNFTFRVQAINAEGAVSPQDATVALHVQAPLYRRWWFYAALLVLTGGAAYGLYWLRLRRVRRDFSTVLQERNRIAREIHDTLAQDFVAVSLQLEVTSELLRAGAVDAAKEQVDSTRTLVREGIQDARESIWAIRAESSEKTLPARLAAMVKRVESASLSVTGAYRALPDSREREVFRIAKEALGNAQRHARAAHIQVDLVYSEDAVLLRVSDDGAGFDVAAGAAKVGHYGVRGMRERAAGMGATLTVRSASGQGTCVELRCDAC